METREQRGMEIEATTRIRKSGNNYLVPSQSKKGTTYTVSVKEQHCSCPDFELRQLKCKHLYAVEFTVKRERTTGNIITTETLRITYSQDWRSYNAAQTNEKVWFTKLLTGLTRDIPQPPQTNGRPRLPLSDMVFASTYKVYSMFSSRRFTADLREAHADGLIACAPHFNSVSNYLADSTLTPLLKSLIEQSAAPLRAVEVDFAVDSSGFATSTYARWFDHKWGKERTRQTWVKAHLMTGIKTNIVTAVEATPTESNDGVQFPGLVERTAKTFAIAEVSADKAYSTRRNLNAVDAVGGTAFIPFKFGTTGAGHGFDPLWAMMWAYYQFNREAFLEHYHKRSNAETTFAMIKAKFGGAVKSKSPTAQVNEVLCKVLAHNICVLIQSMYELGLEPTFCAEMPIAQKVPA